MPWSELFPAFRALPLDWARTPVLIAVSGGADSLALTLAYQALREAVAATSPWYTATVDHRLRPESRQEAEQVARWLGARNIPHATLVWDHAPVTARIEEQARQARYALLIDFAKAHQCSVLLTAHHALDQIETVLMRAARGSGLTGLRGMTFLSERDGVTIVRPFLTIFPGDLRLFLAQAAQPFVVDSSNGSNIFERVRWRKTLTFFGKRGLNLKGFSRAIENLQTIEDQLTMAAQVFIKANVHLEKGHGLCFLLHPFRALLPAVGERVLKCLLQDVSQDAAPCPHRVLEGLHQKLLNPFFRGATAHRCILKRVQGQRVLITPEVRRRKS